MADEKAETDHNMFRVQVVCNDFFRQKIKKIKKVLMNMEFENNANAILPSIVIK